MHLAHHHFNKEPFAVDGPRVWFTHNKMKKIRKPYLASLLTLAVEPQRLHDSMVAIKHGQTVGYYKSIRSGHVLFEGQRNNTGKQFKLEQRKAKPQLKKQSYTSKLQKQS